MRLNILFAVVISLTMVACGKVQSVTEEAHEHHEGHEGVTFNPKSGLLVPETTAKFIGLQIAAVEERKVCADLQFTATVYQGIQETRLASLSATVPGLARATALLGLNEAKLLSQNQQLRVKTDEDAVLQGLVFSLNTRTTNSSGQVEVLVGIRDATGRLKTGTSVSVSARIAGEKTVVSVPNTALLKTTEGVFVYTVSGERFVRARVKLGTTDADFSEIADGLYTGDQVVSHPVMTLWMAELQSTRGGKACADGH
jgi:hypothetical protein